MMEDQECGENKPASLNNFKLVTIIFLSLLAISGCIYGLISVSNAKANDSSGVLEERETQMDRNTENHMIPQSEVSEDEVLFIAESSGTSYIYDLKTSKIKKLKHKLQANDSGFENSSGFQVSPDGKSVAFCSTSSTSSDKYIMMWDGNDRKIEKIEGLELRDTSFRFLSDGSGIVFIGDSRHIYKKIFKSPDDENSKSSVVKFGNIKIPSRIIVGVSNDDKDVFHCVWFGRYAHSGLPPIIKLYKNSERIMNYRIDPHKYSNISFIEDTFFLVNDDEKVFFFDVGSKEQEVSSFQIEECTKIKNIVQSTDGLSFYVQCHRFEDENESNYSLVQVKVEDIEDGIVVKIEKVLMSQCNGEILVYPSPESIQIDNYEDLTTEEINSIIPQKSLSETCSRKPIGVSVSPEYKIHDGGQVFVIYDPDCRQINRNRCELVLFNSETNTKVYITGQNSDYGARKFVKLNYNPKVATDGKVIGFVRSIDGGSTFHIMLVDRNGGNLRKLGRIYLVYPQFYFTPDGTGIVYVGIDQRTIFQVDLNGENYKVLMDASFAHNLETIYNSVLLQNGALVYVGRFKEQLRAGIWIVHNRICMKKGDMKNHCWDNESSPNPKLIPFGEFVYCVSDKGIISKIDTNNTEDNLKSFSINGLHKFIDGTISKDGKYLYLIPSNGDEKDNYLIKVDVAEVSFNDDETQIKSGEIIMPFIKGNIVALVPSLA